MIGTETLDEIVERIEEYFHPEKIILFGSYARGEATEDSDVDLLIVAETDLPPRERFPAARRLLSDIPASFDLILKTPEEYRRRRSVVNHIVYFADKYGKVIYERRDASDKRLVQLAAPKCPELSRLADQVDALTDHAIQSRYPGDWDSIDRIEMNEMTDLAKQFADILLPKLRG
jgi:predicted nucleotidyltransferase